MRKFVKSIHKAEYKCNAAAEYFLLRYPAAGYLVVSIGMPIAIVAAIYACTTILALPLALLFGWY